MHAIDGVWGVGCAEKTERVVPDCVDGSVIDAARNVA